MSRAASSRSEGSEPHLFHPLRLKWPQRLFITPLRNGSSQSRQIGSQSSTSDNRASSGRSESPLQKLPLELILEIVSHLTPVDITSWCYTCRQFNQILDSPEVIRKLPKYRRKDEDDQFSGSLHLPYCNRRLLAAHVDLLCLLDRDGKLSSHKAICYACSNTHDKSAFTPESLDKVNTERKCLGVTGRVWICPHFSLSFEQILSLDYEQNRSPSGFCEDCRISVRVWQKHSIVKIPICNFPPGCSKMNEVAAAALDNFHLQSCPHLKLREAVLPDLYSMNCSLRTAAYKESCDCSRCTTYRRSGQCSACGTQVLFQTQSSEDGRRTLWVSIRRYFWRSCRGTHGWLEQLVQPEMTNRWMENWNQTATLCERMTRESGECPYQLEGNNYWREISADWLRSMKEPAIDCCWRKEHAKRVRGPIRGAGLLIDLTYFISH